MGIFKKQKPINRNSDSRSVQPNAIVHHATLPANGVTFFINPEGVSWNYDKEYNWMFDGQDTDAALAQLERAYHLNVSFPDAEENVMSIYRIANPNLSETTVPYYDWKPPLPNS